MFSALRQLLLSEAERWMLWLPVLLGCGIYFYFSLSVEPSIYAGISAFSASVSGILLAKRWAFLRMLMLAMAMFALGFAAAQFQAWRLDTSTLERPIPFTHLRGHLAQVIDTEEGMKLVIDNPVAEKNWKPLELPQRIRLNLRTAEPQLAAGQEIRLRGGLFPLPQPVLPGGYDIARHFYFEGIGAVGYALPNIEIISQNPPNAWQEKLSALRQHISRLIRTEISGAAGTIADSLITGEQSAIPKQVREDMAIAGIAHILSISGLHLSLVAGILFVALRQLLVFIPMLALRFPVKKIAAFFALLGTAAYLALAGFPVAANRSFVMAALVLGTVIFDRQVLSMRSVALAAMLILLVSPESLMGPSFQLSFAATAAIVALYETYARKPLAGKFFDSWLLKPWFYLTGIVLTSLVAGLATTPFVILHFQQFTIYQVIANLGTSPLLSFLVMPAAMLAMLGMPFGLQDIGLTLMQYGIDGIIRLSHWVAGLPMAVSYVPGFPAWGMALMTFGGFWFCFWRQKWRMIGIPLVLAGAASLWTMTPPDVVIAPEAVQVALRLHDGHYAMVKGGTRNFTAKIWAESLGFTEYADLKQLPEWKCDRAGCFYQSERLTLSLPKRREVAAEDCVPNTLMIADFYPDCRGKNVIARPKNAMALWLNSDSIVKKQSISYVMRRGASQNVH